MSEIRNRVDPEFEMDIALEKANAAVEWEKANRKVIRAAQGEMLYRAIAQLEFWSVLKNSL